ncbi:MAG: hypothetical protein JWN98_1900 [Abditibacteriota bacterium]|jgi:hypothetical protein|nr:hypothetical protein [Abditibacteriota bacterium]
MKRSAGCLLILLLLVGGALFGVWRARQAPVVGDAVPFAKLPAPEKQRRREEVRVLESKVKEIQRSAKRGEKKPFAIELTEDQLNTVLQDRIDTSKFPISDLRAGMEPNRLLVQGHIKYQGLEGAATLTGNIEVKNGHLNFIAESLQFGVIPAPSKWKTKVETEISKRLNEALANAPGRIDKVAIEQGKMTISGITD